MKHTSDLLKTVICPAAFDTLQIYKSNSSVCCPNWFDVEQIVEEFPNNKKLQKNKYGVNAAILEDRTDLLGHWNSEFYTELRKSILDGSYRFCSKKCPHIDRIYSDPDFNHNLLRDKKELESRGIDFNNPMPQQIILSFDDSCNLKCPTCRVKLISNKDNEDGIASILLDTVEKQFGPSVKQIGITGSGDPFYSNNFREYLHNFDSSKYPNLETIFLNTNGIMWTPKNWEYIKAAHPYINGTEWSIDAGSKYTYENITRLNGKWDTLLRNMDYLSTLEINNIVFSFVVQEANFMEMVPFVELIQSKFTMYDYDNPEHNYISTATIMFRAMQDWGHNKKDWWDRRDITNPSHPKHRYLLPEIEKVHEYEFVGSNLQHLISDYKNKVGGLI